MRLDTTDTDGDGDLTADELVANNPRQGWSDRADWNFTAQLTLAASYGLGQIMYETALVRGFDNRFEPDKDDGRPARDIYELFKADVSIDLSADYLKEQYDKHGQDWWWALYWYNGAYDNPDPEEYDSEDYANDVMQRWNNGNGIYKLITE